MIITKLNWAGVLVQVNETTILIDPLGDTVQNQGKPLVAQFGAPQEDIIPLTSLPRPDAILITHAHSDHFSPKTLLDTFGAEVPVFMPHDSLAMAGKAGFTKLKGLSVGETAAVGSVTVSATYSIDGFGSPQVAWIVEGEGKKIIHCGDTLWHGYWLNIAHKYGSFDVAFLPINAAILEIPGLPKQSQLPACMGPEEAVEAAYLLGVKSLIPIHYNTFHNPPYYIETENALARMHERAVTRGVGTRVLQPAETIEL
ncbi:L-ascorbate metabolism protein UlaG (beta-lactamase superfamily) [Caldalkalibacillus uzonensis]|uniref:L-ascorbate metabolism protein UlaG (Beta-lactamase superfamily) n=1 Tax=Caldalkalibacillus uzonensis TaxID=353224 RepID=A0ABU0CV89_9BACI|nr:MBL fold metallo-hydrolase [Caldalkalibacillus uzonensis]MDQ0339799.1 L-ascorbate metabolism protein UlaG (beta-lactamase superfamily) [Caldalkalibacillus uzonensis]